MMTRPGGWKGLGAHSERSAAAEVGRATEEQAPISGQRCVPVTGPQRPAPERRGARTQLGMPALTAPPSQPAPSEQRCAGDSAVSARPRRLPPPLPAHFAAPKVVIAPAPRLPDTLPARRLQLQETTCEIDAVELLPPPRKRAAPPARAPVVEQRPRRRGQPRRGLRELLAKVLLRLLAMVAPSLLLPPARELENRRRSARD